MNFSNVLKSIVSEKRIQKKVQRKLSFSDRKIQQRNVHDFWLVVILAGSATAFGLWRYGIIIDPVAIGVALSLIFIFGMKNVVVGYEEATTEAVIGVFAVGLSCIITTLFTSYYAGTRDLVYFASTIICLLAIALFIQIAVEIGKWVVSRV